MADQMLRPKLKLVETAPAEPNRPPALQSGVRWPMPPPAPA